MKILLLGDCHAQWFKLHKAIQFAQNKYSDTIDCVIQVGDFGFYPELFKSIARLPSFDVPVYAIDGNHENHSWLHNKMIKRNKHLAWQKNHNLFFMERGTVQEFDTATIAFVGGAFNVDRPQEGVEDKPSCNYIGPKEVKKYGSILNEYNKIHLMVTHGCPGGLGIGVQGHPGFLSYCDKYIHRPLNLEPFPLHDVGEHPLTDLYFELKVKPETWVFGHYHQLVYRRVQETEFYCIGCTDGTDGYVLPQCFIYDTIKKEIEYLN